MNKLKRFIGDKNFYKQVARIIIPIMIQQLTLSLAGYIDSLMINSYGGVSDPSAYNGVSAANKLMFVLNFTWIAAASVASIFISQFFGAKNSRKINESVRLSLYIAVIMGVIAFFIVEFAGDRVVDMFIQDSVSRNYGYRYLDYIKWATVVTAMGIALSNAFRSVEQTGIPLVAAISGIVVNICFNYCFIFGHFGFPEMDSAGAALATLISRVVEVIILFCMVFFSKKSQFKTVFSEFKVSGNLVKSFVKRGAPLLLNETLWATSSVLFAMFYAWKDDTWYNAYAYSQNITDLFFIMFAGLGSGTAVIVGASLGAGNFDEARLNADRMKGLAVILGLGLGILMFFTSPYIADLFQPSPEVKGMTIDVVNITAVFLAIYAYNATCFYILRAGGDSVRAFILDQLPSYVISMPLAIIFGINAKAWGLSLANVFLIAHVCDIIKLFVSTLFVRKEKWVVNLTVGDEGEKELERLLEEE